jgi:mannose-1-phosphate guanylyltransferase
MVEASFDWDDVGSWRAVAAYLAKDEHKNAANCCLTTMDASDNIVFSNPPSRIALLGVHNLIVVRTGDSLLVCNRRDAERIKDLVSKLPPELQ